MISGTDDSCAGALGGACLDPHNTTRFDARLEQFRLALAAAREVSIHFYQDGSHGSLYPNGALAWQSRIGCISRIRIIIPTHLTEAERNSSTPTSDGFLGVLAQDQRFARRLALAAAAARGGCCTASSGRRVAGDTSPKPSRPVPQALKSHASLATFLLFVLGLALLAVGVAMQDWGTWDNDTVMDAVTKD